MLEAEIKLRIDAERAVRLRERLVALGAGPEAHHVQVDTYFAHPGRDFAVTDEALRLRSDGGAVRITYKGPRLDPPRKTREEIEFGLAADLDTSRRLLERLGFTPVATVRKRRAELCLPGDPEALVSIDDVDGLGLFCEVEVAATTVEEGRVALAALTARLGLGELPLVAESYLELLLRTPA